ncbi:MAG: pentapeptide repeat-containing protein [Pseudomonadota bacterium]
MEKIGTGSRAEIGDGGLPGDVPDLVIRAGVIRVLLLNLDPSVPVHDKGVRLRGARIRGSLDFQGVDCTNDLSLSRCVLENPASFLNASMRGLYLSGCHTNGISADNASFSGSVFLRKGFHNTGDLSMPGARIAGDLQVCDAMLDGQGQAAIFANSMQVEGSVYLGDYPYDGKDSEMRTQGAMLFSNVVVGQDFFVRNVSISAAGPTLPPATLQDGAEGGNSVAFSLVRANVGGAFYFKQNQISGGIVNLSGARVRRLNDEPDGMGADHAVRLDGFEYKDFAQHTDVSVPVRLAWLARRPEGIEFRAQPYEHLARVLYRIGHREDATDVLIEKERLQRNANRDLSVHMPFGGVRRVVMGTRDTLMRWLVGYGYRPLRSVYAALILIAALTWYFDQVWRAGDMAPAAAPVLVSQDWIAATQTHAGNPAAHWASKGQAGQDYETFNAFAYAADLLIPIVNLGQEEAWGPSTSRSDWGWHGWWIRWAAKIVGWIVTALGAAAVTGVIRRQ